MPLNQKLTGSRLKSLRIAQEIKQDEVARCLGLKQGAISSHEMGNSMPNAASLVWYAERYEVSTDYILGLTDDPRPYKKAAPGSERPDAISSIQLLSENSDQQLPLVLQQAIADILPQLLRKILPEVLLSALTQYNQDSLKHEP